MEQRFCAQQSWSCHHFVGGRCRGKEGAIKRVTRGLIDKAVSWTSSKVSTTEELGHDYLWRAAKRLPPRGDIGIFNRWYHEEVLVVRVHQEVLKMQRLP